MTNHTRSSQVPLAALLLAGLSAACMADPLAGTSPSDDAGAGAADAPVCTDGNPWCSGVGIATHFSVVASPGQQEVDILFLVDNSPSMDPKQAALAANFPRMIQQLQQLPGGLPDVHIGVISSDMGAGSEGIGGNCDVPLGDKGLLWGNVPTTSAACDGTAPVRATFAPGSCWALAQNPPITDGCGLFSGARWIEDIQNPNGLGRQQNYTGNLTDVFSCMARAVGVNGCGYEHQLQSLRVSLYPQDGINDTNIGFLRPNAYLAIVLVTDEDDCSADVSDLGNDSMFLQRPMGETASMKCAARGHICNGNPIPNYAPANGYAGSGFSTSLANCGPKDQPKPSQPNYAYLPLIRVQDMIDSVNKVKARPTEQILVSGIIGWPENDDPTSVQYQIGVDPTSLPPPQNTYWDYMPICTIPSQRSADGNIYKAYGGLRLKKFIDAYGQHGQHFSICNSDFTGAVTQIGKTIVRTLTADCFPYPLLDGDSAAPGIQPECQVVERVPCSTPGVGGCVATGPAPTPAAGTATATATAIPTGAHPYSPADAGSPRDSGVAATTASGYAESSLAECRDGQGKPLDPTSPALDSVSEDARPCWYLSYDTDPVVGCPDAPKGQKISVARPTGTVAPAGAQLALTCLTCPASNPDCVVASP